MSLFLASGSQIRRDILRNAGVAFEVAKSGVDEDLIKAAMRAENIGPSDQAMALAEAKAARVSNTRPGLVIGADQMLSVGRDVFDKPVDQTDLRLRLLELKGKTHRLETAVCIAEDGAIVWRFLARPALTMRAFSDAFLEQYLERVGDTVLSSVGGYHFEGLGAQLFSEIEGDYYAILGLPLIPLLDYLRIRGILQP